MKLPGRPPSHPKVSEELRWARRSGIAPLCRLCSPPRTIGFTNKALYRHLRKHHSGHTLADMLGA